MYMSSVVLIDLYAREKKWIISVVLGGNKIFLCMYVCMRVYEKISYYSGISGYIEVTSNEDSVQSFDSFYKTKFKPL